MHGRAVLSLPTVVLLVACSTPTLDAAETERAIRATVSDRYGVVVDRVTCPDDVKAEEGGTFRCTVRAADGSNGSAVVTQQDDDGNVRARTPFLRVAGVERVVARGLEAQSGARSVRLTCPDIVTVDVGGSFTCRARAGRQRARVRVTQQGAGGVRWRLVQR